MGVMSSEDWDQGRRCAADDLPYCHRCKPKPFPINVVVSTGWAAAFHCSANCTGLNEGQRKVERRGGSPAPVKNEWGMLPFRVRGTDRIQLHVDLTILAQLATGLAKARAAVVPLAA